MWFLPYGPHLWATQAEWRCSRAIPGLGLCHHGVCVCRVLCQLLGPRDKRGEEPKLGGGGRGAGHTCRRPDLFACLHLPDPRTVRLDWRVPLVPCVWV